MAERLDGAYAHILRLMPLSPRRRVLVVGIYRDAEPIDRAVEELSAGHHFVVTRLGSMAEPKGELAQSTVRSHLTAGKFQNINELLLDPSAFDWLVLIDDDVALPSHFLDRAVALCERLDVALAQPAQTRQSNANWRITKRQLFTVARETEFVEIGPVTLVRSDAAELLTPFPKNLRYGWGLDFHWAYVMKSNGLRMAILDSLAVVHASRKVASTYSWDVAQEEGQKYLASVPHASTDVTAGNGVRRFRWIPRPSTPH